MLSGTLTHNPRDMEDQTAAVNAATEDAPDLPDLPDDAVAFLNIQPAPSAESAIAWIEANIADANRALKEGKVPMDHRDYKNILALVGSGQQYLAALKALYPQGE